MQKEKLTYLYEMLEQSATDEKNEESYREKLVDKLEAYPKRKEEDEATCLIEEMRKKWKLHNTKV